MPNRLRTSPSPYLRQHADNPVDWYPWGPEAFARAKDLDRPILLSIGYAACHWCHVMAHESFEDPDIAGLINAAFVAIKVDREEHPAVDASYQAIAQMATGQGGWPLTVFCTPDLRPFYVGTYFPPHNRSGHPGFAEVVGAIAALWQDDRSQIQGIAESWTTSLQQAMAVRVEPSGRRPTSLPVTQAAERMLEDFDHIHGGFGTAPKFPQTDALEVLLRAGGDAAKRAHFTLHCIASGGITDQFGGGFHRYSVDAAWQVPHFEKMLYDNALLTSVYLHAFQQTGDPSFRNVAEAALDFLLGEMRSPEGAFFTSLDADSLGPNGHLYEGAYYTWTPEEIVQVVGQDAAPRTCEHFGITANGNFEHGRSVPHLRALSRDDWDQLPTIRAQLRAARARRPRPARDDKVLAGWNGLVLSALSQAARIVGDPRYQEAAQTLAAFLLSVMRQPDGGLWRCHANVGSAIPGTLEDYAYVTLGLIDLYEGTMDPHWLGASLQLARQIIARFWESKDDTLYLVERDTPLLLIRPHDDTDGSTPCAQSSAVSALLRLAPFTDAPSFRTIPERIIARLSPLMEAHPRAVASLVLAQDRLLPLEITLAPSRDDPTVVDWLVRLNALDLPPVVLTVVAPQVPGSDELPPIWRGRQDADRPTAWVCRGGTCQNPAHTWDALQALIQGAIMPA